MGDTGQRYFTALCNFHRENHGVSICPLGMGDIGQRQISNPVTFTETFYARMGRLIYNKKYFCRCEDEPYLS